MRLSPSFMALALSSGSLLLAIFLFEFYKQYISNDDKPSRLTTTTTFTTTNHHHHRDTHLRHILKSAKAERHLARNGFIQLGSQIDGPAHASGLGFSIDMNGDGSIIAVGSTTFHVVFEFSGSDWVQKGSVIQCAQDLTSTGINTVAISSNGRFLVTACAVDDQAGVDAGIVGVWEYDDTNNDWSNRQVFLGESPGDQLGYSVAISDDGVFLVIGASTAYDGLGEVYVYGYNFWPNMTNQYAPFQNLTDNYLRDSTGNETATSDIERFGNSVAISNDGKRLIVGAPGDDSSVAFNIGQAFVFELTTGDTTGASLYVLVSRPLEAEGILDLFGYAVATNGDGSIYAIGAPVNSGSVTTLTGHVRVYRRGMPGEDEALIKIGSDIDGTAQGGFFGSSVALSADGLTLVVGAWLANRDANRTFPGGLAKMYHFDGTDWQSVEFNRTRRDELGGFPEFVAFGWDVEISHSGDRIVVGSPFNFQNATFAGGSVNVYSRTDYPTFSPIVNPLPQVAQVGRASTAGATSSFFGAIWQQVQGEWNAAWDFMTALFADDDDIESEVP